MVRLNISVEIHLQKENRRTALIYVILKLQYFSLRKQWLLIAPNCRVSISRNFPAVPRSEETKRLYSQSTELPSKTFVDAEYFDCRLQVSLPAEPADSCGVLYIEDSERSLTLPPLTSQSLEHQSNEVLEVPSLTSATSSR